MVKKSSKKSSQGESTTQPRGKVLFPDKGGKFDIIAEMHRADAEIREDWEMLRKTAKPLHELVQKEYFTVTSVLVENQAVYHRTVWRAGDSGERAVSGYTIETHIGVKSRVAHTAPVNELLFLGSSQVQIGDLIHVMIPRYEERLPPPRLGVYSPGNPLCEAVFVDRGAYLGREQAIEIEILDKKKNAMADDRSEAVLRTERSVDYAKYMKK